MAATVGGALTRAGRRASSGVLLGLPALLLAGATLLPLAMLAVELFTAPGPLAQVLEALPGSRTATLLATSTAVATGVTAVALALGVPLALLFARFDVPGRHVLLALHAFPLFLPPLLPALGWFHLLGRRGLVGTGASSELLFGPVGLVGTLSLSFAPVVTVLTTLGIGAVDASFEDAARVVARPGRAAMHIVLPLAWPAMALGALIVFALTFSEVAVPMFLRVDTYAAAVFSRLGGVRYAPGEALVLSLPMVTVGLVLLVLERGVSGRRAFDALGLRRRATRWPLKRHKLLATAFCGLAALAAITPLSALVHRAGWHGLVQSSAWVGESLATSLRVAALAATGIVVLGMVLGHAAARAHGVGRTADMLSVLAFFVPAGVLGAGLIATWNRSSTQMIYTTSAILVFGLIARYAVLGVRTVAVAVRSSSPHLEQAAAVFGAGPWRRLLTMVLPMHATGIGAAWLLAFIFCLRDLDTVVTFYPPGLEPLTVRIFTLEANGPPAVVAGLAVLQVLSTAAALAVGIILLRRIGRGR